MIITYRSSRVRELLFNFVLRNVFLRCCHVESMHVVQLYVFAVLSRDSLDNQEAQISDIFVAFVFRSAMLKSSLASAFQRTLPERSQEPSRYLSDTLQVPSRYLPGTSQKPARDSQPSYIKIHGSPTRIPHFDIDALFRGSSYHIRPCFEPCFWASQSVREMFPRFASLAVRLHW